MVVRGHVEVARLRRMVRGLLRYVVRARVVWQVPVASEYLAKDRIEGLLYATIAISHARQLTTL